MNLALGMRF